MRRFRQVGLPIALFLFLTPFFGWLIVVTGDVAAQATKKPRLAVFVVFDQMKADYQTRWKHLFDKDGFGKLQKEGAWFQNCNYPYAFTLTAAGHASMATGCSPEKHGIIANSWFDRQLGEVIESIESEKYPFVPSPPPDPKAKDEKKKEGAAPIRLKQPNFADALMDQTNDKAKVVSFSIKDRGAILLAALRALLCAWLNPDNGLIVTSTFYNGGQVPGWLTKMNKDKLADKWFAKEWTRIRPDLNYDLLIGPDDFKYEGVGYKQGKTFPHSMTGGQDKPGAAYYKALGNSPFGNDLLIELAKKAIVEEKLGQDDVPDLLTLSFSSNDYIGHCWGPDSQEMLDVTLRSDLLVKDLLQFLDKHVGQGQYLFVLCSDHGVCPLPEVRKAKGFKNAGRVPVEVFTGKAQAHLNLEFGNGKELKWISSFSSGQIYLNDGTIAKAGVKKDVVEKSLAAWLAKQKGIQAVYTRSQLLAGATKGDPIGEAMQRSFHAECSGDVIPILKPYWLIGDPLSLKDTGNYTTSHGTPHKYDTHVPLLVFGPNVKPGIYSEEVTPQAVASIIAAGLGIQPPKAAEAPVPKGLFK